jgi:TolB protein
MARTTYFNVRVLAVVAALALAACLLALVVRVEPSQAAFPGQNGKIAFQSNRDGNLEIYTMNPDGSNQTNISNNAAHGDADPAWSPDGTKIAFESNRDGNAQMIYVMNADGSNPTNISNNLEGWDYYPAWSPDGTKIAFLSERDGPVNHGEIYTMNPDGANQTNISNNPADDFAPDWQPITASVPTTKVQCKKGGWKDFGYPNQGTCISDVNRRNR